MPSQDSTGSEGTTKGGHSRSNFRCAHYNGSGSQRGGSKTHVDLITGSKLERSRIQTAIKLSKGHERTGKGDASDNTSKIDTSQVHGIELLSIGSIDVVTHGSGTGGQTHQGVEGSNSLRKRSRFHTVSNVVTRSSSKCHPSRNSGGSAHGGSQVTKGGGHSKRDTSLS